MKQKSEHYMIYAAHLPDISIFLPVKNTTSMPFPDSRMTQVSIELLPAVKKTQTAYKQVDPLMLVQNHFIRRQTDSYQAFLGLITGLLSLPTFKKYPGPAFSREDLELLSSGKISLKFGDWFRALDQYDRLIRMPEPPLLLADRVLGIDAEPASFKTGTLWTETDVKADSWYLHQDGRMPCGIMIEAGQADLLLISWLGFDFYNKGQRVYRLLGCELTFYGELPKVGETLLFDIHVDGHAKQGDIRLFFFHYDCHVNHQLRMKVRHGQAGFFTDEELAQSGGVLWSPETADYDRSLPVEAPIVRCEYHQFSKQQITEYASGNGFRCFGKGFDYLQTHTRTPSIPSGRLLLIDNISLFDVTGGPWQRGYMQAVQHIQATDWFFQGHFKNDPCMPGTLMLEAGLQTMMIYMAALGCTLDKDGWRFEPVPEKTYRLSCRGQVIPSSRQIVYEIFIESFSLSPFPVLQADLLGTVDGLKAFHTKIGLRLIPDWPLGERKEKKFRYDEASLMACALGKPSDAFGDMYAVFDQGKGVARLPAPPYHFISRIVAIQAIPNSLKPAGKVQVEFDILADAWYFQQNSHPVMPFCVLLEAGLQPCGWLASFLGCALISEERLFFRNLDGTGTVFRSLTPADKLLNVSVECVNVAKLAKMLIIAFKVSCFVNNDIVYQMDTVFGFFPDKAFEQQTGLPVPEYEKKYITGSSDCWIDLTKTDQKFPLPSGQLRMIDVVTGYWPEAGSQHKGLMRAQKKVNPSEWFFKAHFFQDPVQPGSLGIEAMIQLAQFYLLYKNYHHDLPDFYFEPLTVDHQSVSWQYRGQVRPHNQYVHILIDILEEGIDSLCCPYVKTQASLWVDGKRIYAVKGLGVKMKLKRFLP